MSRGNWCGVCNEAIRGSGARPQRRALTVVEVAVSVAAIVVVAGLLLPAAGVARVRARGSTCVTNLAAFGQAMQTYADDNAGWIPGVNTSGVTMRSLVGTELIHQSHVPVQSFDWMTPLMPYLHDEALPERRAERWELLFDEFSCPQMAKTSMLFGSDAPDMDEFVALAPWTAVSYLMPVYFQYWGEDYQGTVVGEHELGFPIVAATIPGAWEVSHQTYRSRLTEVGPAERKIFVADGTRYLGSSGVLTHDVSPNPAFLGAFSSASGWWSGSTAYGVRDGSPNWDGDPVQYGSPSSGRNLPLSYRHSSGAAIEPAGALSTYPGGDAQHNFGALNVVCFDGHVETLNDEASREIDRWYPSGGVVETVGEGMTTEPLGYVIP
jgi:hypothetical protein